MLLKQSDACMRITGQSLAIPSINQQASKLRFRKVCSGVSWSRCKSSNREVIAGDVIVLTSFSLYKQISAIALSPSFEGWLAPLKFNPIRFVEWFAFATTLVASWAAASFLVDGYRTYSTDLPSMLRKTSVTWLVSMPVAASQLVISTAAESSALVGDEGWIAKLPLAASGPGEPFTTAAGVLGVMAIWRAFYCTHLDVWNASDRLEWSAYRFREAVFMVCVMGALGSTVLAVLRVLLSPDDIEKLDDFVRSVLHMG